MKTLPTQNEDWGFYGTIKTNGTVKTDDNAARIYAKASRAIVAHGFSKMETREFLDSRSGRHMADEITSQKEVPAVVKSWLEKGWVASTVKQIAKEKANG